MIKTMLYIANENGPYANYPSIAGTPEITCNCANIRLRCDTIGGTQDNRMQASLQMLNGLLGQQLLRLFLDAQKLEGRLDDAVEQKGGIHQQGEADNLQPLERLPSEAERHNPDEERPARVNGGARGGTDGAGNGEPKEVEAAIDGVSSILSCSISFTRS